MIQRNNAWIKNAIIYHILIDRFSGFKKDIDWNQPVFCGGNINGIIQKIPYLQNLGIDTIWISPFYKTNAYHGYHITNFFEVDPRFGTKDDLQNLVTTAHESGLRIIADFVPNHCSYKHPYFIDAQTNKKSPYRKWFYFTHWPNEYLSFLSFHEIPKLNLQYTKTRDHIIQSALYWLSFGFDGFRLDHVIGPSNSFWKQFSSEIYKAYPATVLIGEAWMQGIRFTELKTIKLKGKYYKWFAGKTSYNLLRSYQNLLDGVLDFQGQKLLHYYGHHGYSTSDMKKLLNTHYNKFNDQYILPLFLDNHDMDRILYSCNNDRELVKKLATVQFSMDQPVIIYYGTEIGMTQDTSMWNLSSHGDIVARQPMKWNNINEELYMFYQNLCHKRTKKKIPC